jgi:ABC-2 type transport system permease protein
MSNIKPIADLSYRNYDGPLKKPGSRWWVIAKNGIRIALKKKALWGLMFVSAWYYLVMLVVLFFVQQVTSSNPAGAQAMKAFMERLVWPDQFLHGFSYAQLPMLIIALMLGAGSIANDNRANAMLVYLSKPCDKREYLFGKWIGIALPIFVIMVVPTIIFYGYGALTFREYGFLKDAWLLPKMLAIIPIAAIFHASIVVGISSMFNQARNASATYAGIYFITNFFTLLMGGIWASSRGETPFPVKHLFYASIDGVLIGVCKAIIGTKGSAPFGIQSPGGVSQVPAPNVAAILGIALLISVVFVLIAWRKIRAVEVIG